MFSTRFYAATKEYTTFTSFVPAPYLRRTLTLERVPAKAELTVCGLGFYELSVNGVALTKGKLAPYISNPDDLLYYDRYDLTPYLTEGKNALGFILGNGMLNCPGGEIWDFQTARFRSAPKLAFSLDLDGRILEADENLRCAPSPIYFDDLRAGEFYDARRETEGWDLPDFDDSAWTKAIPAETPRGVCRLCEAEPIRTRAELKPVSVTRGGIDAQPHIRENLPVVEPLPDEDGEGFIYDFGVNTTGVIRLKINGREGQKLTLQYGECLGEKGGLDLTSMSFLPRRFNHRDIYICRGGEQNYTPRFTYHGFRYCLVIGLTPDQATSDLLTYVELSSELKTNAGFECSDERSNKIWQAGVRSDWSNFFYFPTDCPHREKNGWTGDAQLSAEQMLTVMTPENSYREWLRNIRAAQRSDGALPGIVPTTGWGMDWGNGPAWDSVSVSLPYNMWLLRGDTDVIRDNAEMMMRYLRYVNSRRDGRGLVHIGLGDWCPVGGGEPKAPLEFTDSAVMYDYCTKAGRLFRAASLTAEADYAAAVGASLRTAIRTYLIDTDTASTLDRCQTTQAQAIAYGLFDAAEKPEAFRVLLDIIRDCGDSLDTGIIGARVIFRVLSDFGRTDLAYHMIAKPDYPSYGSWIEQGATSFWEQMLPPGQFHDSRNHHMYGDVVAWYIRYIAGIEVNPYLRDPSEIVLCPRFIDALTSASAWQNLPAGKVEVSYVRDGGTAVYKVTAADGVTGSVAAADGWLIDGRFGRRPLKSGEYRFVKTAK